MFTKEFQIVNAEVEQFEKFLMDLDFCRKITRPRIGSATNCVLFEVEFNEDVTDSEIFDRFDWYLAQTAVN